ncbi:MAG TPA: cupin [Candidatus Woesebacteria bacterium]|jgi:mannose-6-phosphate isomerase-like protein (cupin superfamily)|nr:cupin [Candidatus Shapirobacteria bacterium]HOR01718.1 cupin [Candidatus Woesebacteria bacterium]
MTDINQISQQQVINKPWGKEIIYTNPDSPYTFKQIIINNGHRLSLQSHTDKSETFVLIEGQANLVIGPDINNLRTIPMEIKKGYTIPVGTVHRMVGVKNAVILEASTPETGTTIRLQDDYKRPNETEDIRKSDNRGWQ